MFHLGHTDILPVGDLGVRRGMQVLYGLKVRPDGSRSAMLPYTLCYGCPRASSLTFQRGG